MPQQVSGVYAIRNTITGDCYIGSSINIARRRSKHFYQLRNGKHGNQHLQLAFNKYGIHSFEFGLIEEVLEREKLIAREQYWIDHLKPRYNKMLVAESGWQHSPEAIEKIKEVRAKQEVTKDMLEALADGRQKRLQSDDPLMLKPRLGMKNSEETRRKQSEAALNRPPRDLEVIERIAAKNRGRKQSEESNRKRSESLKANKRVWTDEQKAQIAAKNRETWSKKSAEEKRAIAQNRPPEVLEAQRERFRRLGKDPARIEASRQASARAKQQRDEAKQQAKMLQEPMSEEERLEKKRQRYAFTQTPEYKQKMREKRKSADALGKTHGGPKPDPSRPRSRYRTKIKAENIEQQQLFDDSSSG